jgi:Tetratricopeptide repeat
VQEAVSAAPAAEFDLSEEWEGAASIEPVSPAEPPRAEAHAVADDGRAELAKHRKAVADAVEQVRFYLSRFMYEQAHTAMGKVEALTQNPALLASLRAEIAIAEAEAEPEPEVGVAEEVETAAELAPAPVAPQGGAIKEKKNSGVLDEFVSELETSLGDGFLAQTPLEEVPAPPTVPPRAVPAPKARPAEVAAEHKTGILGEFVADLESALPESFLQEAPVPQTGARFDIESEPQPISATQIGMSATAAAAAAGSATALPRIPAQSPAGSPSLTYKPAKMRPLAPPPEKFSAAGVDLAEMFGELKQGLEEEVASADEDPETHYNLGVAFREMGLLDEAIGELQKVCQAIERGHAFPQSMQTYTWLAQCFLDKGVPEAAIRWYEKALKLPGLDADTRMALHYELASAYETAKNKSAALNHFMEVYGANIDYRDVAERIKALKS